MSEIETKIMDMLVDAWPEALTASQIKEMRNGVCQKRAVHFLPQLKAQGFVQDVPRSYYFAWRLSDDEAMRRGLEIPGEKTPSRNDKLVDRPAYVHVDMQPARQGSTDAFMIQSKRQDGYHPYRAPLALSKGRSNE